MESGMKLYITPKINTDRDKGEGGIKRVIENQYKYLPDYGIEIVDDIRDADVINCHATEIEQYGDTPVVISTHGLYWSGYDWPHWAYKANSRIIRGLRHPNVKVVTAPSDFVAQSLRRGALVDAQVVTHGITPAEWKPLKKKRQLLWAKNRADSICDPSVVNKIAPFIPDFNIVSTYGEEDENVEIIHTVPFSVIRKYIRESMIYIANVKETGGITVMEAMAAGTVPLGYRHGVNPDLIEHGVTGYLVEPDDIQGLIDGVGFIYENFDNMSKACQQYAKKNFNIVNNVDGYVQAYEKALQIYRQELSTPKVSVVVTAHNLDEYLPETLDSILNQDMDDWECIIVVDNSPDRCLGIANEYARSDSRFKVIWNHENQYLAESRNIGFRSSKGKYLIPLDADDALSSYALRILSESLDSRTDVHIVTGSMAVYENDEASSLLHNDPTYVSGWPSNPHYEGQLNFRNQVPYASMFRRWVWEDTGGYRRRMISAEDAEFWSRAMSFGAKPEKVSERPTLLYRIRKDSMSHSIPTPDWNAWFPWATYPEFTPFNASGTPPKFFYPVPSYDPPVLTVVIPVGTGHEIYLQDCLDSLVAQTFLDWHCIVVNDTGTPWGDDSIWLQGFPWVQLVDNDGTKRGTGWARNTGVRLAQTDAIVFIDADDYAQPMLLDILYKGWKQVGGWLYTDWYDQEGESKYAQDWSFDTLMIKMLGPCTGIYSKEDIEAVGGFKEDFFSWEDYDLQLSLLENGICGTRIEYNGFTYRYHTGNNREDSYDKRAEALRAIREAHASFYDNRKLQMACKKCGGGGGRKSLKLAGQENNTEDGRSLTEEMVEIKYIGEAIQKRRRRGSRTRKQYTYDGTRRNFFVYKSDVEDFSKYPSMFEVLGKPTGALVVNPMAQLQVGRDPSPIEVYTEDVMPDDGLVEELDILPDTKSILIKAGYTYIKDVDMVENATLHAIKGIGDARVYQIRTAIDQYKSR